MANSADAWMLLSCLIGDINQVLGSTLIRCAGPWQPRVPKLAATSGHAP